MIHNTHKNWRELLLLVKCFCIELNYHHRDLGNGKDLHRYFDVFSCKPMKPSNHKTITINASSNKCRFNVVPALCPCQARGRERRHWLRLRIEHEIIAMIQFMERGEVREVFCDCKTSLKVAESNANECASSHGSHSYNQNEPNKFQTTDHILNQQTTKQKKHELTNIFIFFGATRKQ